MATTTYHAQLIKYTESGDQYILNLKNTGDDVSISRSSNGNIPSTVTTVQTLANKLGSLAFQSSVTGLTTGSFASNVITQATNITAAGYIADARVIKTLNDAITTANNNITALNSNLADTNSSVNSLSSSVSKLDSNLAGKANKYKKVNITLSSGSWSGSSAPYTYTLSVSGVTATNDVNIVLNSTDKSIANAWMDLSVVSGVQTNGSLTLYAYGKKPSANIPISVLVGDEVTV